MTGAERLDAMAAAVREVFTEHGAQPHQVRIDRYHGREIEVEFYPGGTGSAQWRVAAHAPCEVMGFARLAALTVGGHYTPLCRAVVTALDNLMWEDREG